MALWLLYSRRMTSGGLLFRAIVGAIALTGGGMWMTDAHTEPIPYAPGDVTTTVSERGRREPMAQQEREFIIDRYGNRVERAVGDYRVDPRGDIFERHSPATAVTRLPSPRT